jgi:hypothetical protein
VHKPNYNQRIQRQAIPVVVATCLPKEERQNKNKIKMKEIAINKEKKKDKNEQTRVNIHLSITQSLRFKSTLEASWPPSS